MSPERQGLILVIATRSKSSNDDLLPSNINIAISANAYEIRAASSSRPDNEQLLEEAHSIIGITLLNILLGLGQQKLANIAVVADKQS